MSNVPKKGSFSSNLSFDEKTLSCFSFIPCTSAISSKAISASGVLDQVIITPG